MAALSLVGYDQKLQFDPSIKYSSNLQNEQSSEVLKSEMKEIQSGNPAKQKPTVAETQEEGEKKINGETECVSPADDAGIILNVDPYVSQFLNVSTSNLLEFSQNKKSFYESTGLRSIRRCSLQHYASFEERH